MSNFHLRKLANAALAAGLVVAPSAAGVVVITAASVASAPAASAASASAITVQFSGTGSNATATFSSTLGADVELYILVTAQGGSIVSTTPVNVIGGTDAAPAPTVASVQVPYLATATVVDAKGTRVSASEYTNTVAPALPDYQALAPTQVGNIVTIPGAQPGVVYIGAGDPNNTLVPGSQIKLASGKSFTISVIQTNPPLVNLTGTTTWTFTGVTLGGPGQITPAPLTYVSANLYTVPAVSGYHYEANGVVLLAGGDFYVPEGGAHVIAVSDLPDSLQLVGQTSWDLAYATVPTPDEGNTDNTLVCHLDGADKYEPVLVPEAAIKDPHGHASHEGDIYPGHNMDGENAKIYENNCKVPTPPSGDTGDHDNGGNTGGDTGGTDTGNTGGNTDNSGTVTTPVTTTPGGTTTETPSTVTSDTTQTPATSQVSTSTRSSGIRANTAADPSSASNLGVVGGAIAAGLGITSVILFRSRRPKHLAVS